MRGDELLARSLGEPFETSEVLSTKPKPIDDTFGVVSKAMLFSDEISSM